MSHMLPYVLFFRRKVYSSSRETSFFSKFHDDRLMSHMLSHVLIYHQVSTTMAHVCESFSPGFHDNPLISPMFHNVTELSLNRNKVFDFSQFSSREISFPKIHDDRHCYE